MAIAYHGSIGSVNCHYVKGCPPPYLEEKHIWRVPGLDGIGYVLTGKGGPTGRVLAIYFGTGSGLATWYNSLVSLHDAGDPITITNDAGMAFNYCLILNLSPMQLQSAHIPGETATMRATVAITIRRTGS